MKSYTANGYTFTVDELLAGNPCVNSDGTIMDNCATKFMAFNEAKFNYTLDQLPPAERKARSEAMKHFHARMNS